MRNSKGFVEAAACKYCEAKGKNKRDADYDAYYCTQCYGWQEPRCSDATCEFCNNRPLKKEQPNENK